MAVRFPLALLCALLLVPAGARAAVTFGADRSQTPDGSGPPVLRRVPGLTTCASYGVLVHWALRTETAGAGVQPAVYRGASLARWTRATRRPRRCPLTTADVHLPMRAGDQLGVHATGPACRGRM